MARLPVTNVVLRERQLIRYVWPEGHIPEREELLEERLTLLRAARGEKPRRKRTA